MLALNRKEIRKKTLRFCLRFGLLVFGMLFVIYFFVWASVMENRKNMEQIQDYKRIENTQIVLSYKVDSLYWYVSKLNPVSNADEKFLVSYIRDLKQNIRDISTRDSTENFSGYTKIMDRLDEQLNVRDSIIAVEKLNDDTKKALDDCTLKSQKVKKILNRQ